MKTDEFIPFALPDLGEEEINEVIDTLRSGWITTGPKTLQFEQEFASYVGAKHALAVNSATAGLHLALDAIGLSRGDKVITTPYTFTATCEVVRYFDADPIFCDVSGQDYNIDIPLLGKTAENASRQHGNKLKAIIPVHIAGQACNMSGIKEIADRYGLKIIEDAAHALPCTHRGSPIGTLSDITVYSFYATKTITTAEGGMITTNSDEYSRRMSTMRLHGFDRNAWDRYNSKRASWEYDIIAPGYKYNLTDLASSIGLHQLRKADAFYRKRASIAQEYDKAFSQISEISIPAVIDKNDIHAYHLYMLSVPPTWRNRLFDILKAKGIGCSVHFIPLHHQTYWKTKYDLSPEVFPVASGLFASELSLPIYTKLTDEAIQRIIRCMIEAIETLRTELPLSPC